MITQNTIVFLRIISIPGGQPHRPVQFNSGEPSASPIPCWPSTFLYWVLAFGQAELQAQLERPDTFIRVFVRPSLTDGSLDSGLWSMFSSERLTTFLEGGLFIYLPH
ncbi:hypothetical protein VTO42DRAFT_5018 [Malbranchea cinnamomea]